MTFAEAELDWSGETITLLDLMKRILQIENTAQDDELSLYLQMAGEAAEHYIENKIVEQVVVEQFKNLQPPIKLRYWPVSAIDLVESDGEDETVSWSLYYQDGLHWAVHENAQARPGTDFNQLDVTYTCGYNPLPNDLAYAICQGAKVYNDQAGVSGPIKRETIAGVGTIEYDTASSSGSAESGMLPQAGLSTLNHYRRFHA